MAVLLFFVTDSTRPESLLAAAALPAAPRRRPTAPSAAGAMQHINYSTGIGGYSSFDGNGDGDVVGTQANTASPFKKNIIDILQAKKVPPRGQTTTTTHANDEHARDDRRTTMSC